MKREVIWVALVAAVLAVPAAIADEAGTSSLKKDVAKALKNSKTAKKKAKRALGVAEETSKQVGPQGPPGLDGALDVASASDASTLSVPTNTESVDSGPTVEVTIGPGGGYVVLASSVDINSGANATCKVGFSVTGSGGDFYYFTGDNSGGAFEPFETLEMVTRLVPDPGPATVKLIYFNTPGSTNPCEFRNRRITAAPFQPAG